MILCAIEIKNVHGKLEAGFLIFSKRNVHMRVSFLCSSVKSESDSELE